MAKLGTKILILLLAILLAGIGIMSMILLNADTGEISVVRIPAQDIDALEFKSGGEAVRLERNGMDWSYGDNANIPVSGDAVINCVLQLSNLTAIDIYKVSSEKMPDYGIDGQKSLTVHHSSQKTELLIGSLTPDQSGIYVGKTGSTEIFAVALNAGYFLQGGADRFIDPVLIEETGEDAAYDVIKFEGGYGLHLKRKTTQQEADRSLTISTYRMLAPYGYDADTGALAEFFGSFQGLRATGVYLAGGIHNRLGEYGLDNPFVRLSYTLNGREHTVSISETRGDGNAAVTADGIDVIYSLDAQTVASMLIPPERMVSNLPYGVELNKLEGMAITCGQTVYDIRMTGEDSQMKASCNGNQVDTKNVQDYYNVFLTARREGLSDQAGGIPVLTAVFTKRNGLSDTIEFLTLNAQYYLVRINGQSGMLSNKQTVDIIAENTARLAKNEKIEVAVG